MKANPRVIFTDECMRMQSHHDKVFNFTGVKKARQWN